MAAIQEKTSSNLPPEIIEIILSKLLSVKSLLRFKTVCKSWNTIISDPVFVRNHLKNSANNLFLYNHIGIINNIFYEFKLEGRKLHEEATVKGLYGWDQILCECNGVLLLSDSSSRHSTEYALWNPFTRSGMYFVNPYGYSKLFVNHGICYDSVTDDLKVVLIAEERYAVYSCKNSSWTEKKSGRLYSDLRMSRPGMFVDGATYWAFREETYKTIQLVYFDPRTDELKTFQKPEQLLSYDDVWDLCINVDHLRGNLYLYSRSTGNHTTKIQLWIKEKGIPDWKELVTFENRRRVNSSSGMVGFVENKILIRLDWKTFVYYSPSEKTFEEYEENETIGGRVLVPYRNSLYFPTGVKTEIGSTS